MVKIYFHTFGCKTNQYETMLLQEQLIHCGVEVVSSFEKANFCIVNSCTVTQNADADCRQFIRRITRTNPQTRIIITGCYALRASEEIYSACDKNSRVVVIPEEERIFSYLGFSLITNHSSLITVFNGRTRAFVKIQDGCDAFCSYCIVPYVRSKLWSREPGEIITEVRNLVSNGYKEIVLTGIRLGKYQAIWMRHGILDLVDLLVELEKIKGLYRIRLSSLEVNEINERLLKLIANSEKICHHLHIPLQSGDDRILRLMNRQYKTEEFSEKIRQIRNYVPDIGVTTDIIVGFPGEDEERFFSSYQFVERVEFSRIHIFPYSMRPGTVAATLSFQVPAKIKRERMEKFVVLECRLRNKFKQKFINQKMKVLLDKEEKDGTFSGFTSNYIRVYANRGGRNETLGLKIS
ncbi:MAG TPA: tRNA (N(6)-L-threonylcarbamoyladenosine(37)-C(2))-methylthiotransferase MtaB [Elusimicrobia bacterium]|nr:tRNA (N(6)-L-threonylcarbamoyladenosine(37)-C(2))-methylthiotransferase MtaB [Elusimicrobiota bacterium]